MTVVTRRVRVIKGSKLSGHYGHAGRPGQIGGSAPSRREAYEAFSDRIHAGKWRDKKKLGSQGAQAATYYTYVKGGIHCVHKDYGGGRWEGMADNDEAVYLVAEELGIESVPMTVSTDRNNSFQRFANNAVTIIDLDRVFPDKDDVPNAPIEDIENMMYLDVLTGNWDRHWGNFMINTKTGKLLFIDNSSTLRDDRDEAWDGIDMTSDWGKKIARKKISKIIRESVSYTGDIGLPYAGLWPNDPGPIASKFINRSNFDIFAKKARGIGVYNIITSKFGKDGGDIYKRMMVRLDVMEEYVKALEAVHGLRQ